MTRKRALGRGLDALIGRCCKRIKDRQEIGPELVVKSIPERSICSKTCDCVESMLNAPYPVDNPRHLTICWVRRGLCLW